MRNKLQLVHAFAIHNRSSLEITPYTKCDEVTFYEKSLQIQPACALSRWPPLPAEGGGGARPPEWAARYRILVLAGALMSLRIDRQSGDGMIADRGTVIGDQTIFPEMQTEFRLALLTWRRASRVSHDLLRLQTSHFSFFVFLEKKTEHQTRQNFTIVKVEQRNRIGFYLWWRTHPCKTPSYIEPSYCVFI